MAATKLVPPYERAAAAAAAEDDYIDMDISSATLFCYTTTTKCSPPHHSIEFEFQMWSDPLQRGEETTPSPADELFYKGKLLPLHLPPRMEMVEDLTARFHRRDLMNENNVDDIGANVSAPASCYVSGELNPEDYFRGCSASTELQKKRSWSEKLKSISQFNLGRKMKASGAYIKSLFSMSVESSAAAASSQPKACSSGHLNPSTLMKSIERERLADEELFHRKSFSGAINWHLPTTTPKSSSNSMTSSCFSSSSSFSSVNSGGFSGPPLLKRSSSVNSEVESPIEGAIAHCKKSQQPARKSLSDVGGYTLTASKIVAACENKEARGPGLCRG